MAQPLQKQLALADQLRAPRDSGVSLQTQRALASDPDLDADLYNHAAQPMAPGGASTKVYTPAGKTPQQQQQEQLDAQLLYQWTKSYPKQAFPGAVAARKRFAAEGLR